MMRHPGGTILTLALALALAGCGEAGPRYLADGQARTVVCEIGGPLTLTPRDGGRAVSVEGAGPRLDLDWDGRGLMADRYAGKGTVMTVDPEVVITRPDGSRQGPCV